VRRAVLEAEEASQEAPVVVVPAAEEEVAADQEAEPAVPLAVEVVDSEGREVGLWAPAEPASAAERGDRAAVPLAELVEDRAVARVAKVAAEKR